MLFQFRMNRNLKLRLKQATIMYWVTDYGIIAPPRYLCNTHGAYGRSYRTARVLAKKAVRGHIAKLKIQGVLHGVSE